MADSSPRVVVVGGGVVGLACAHYLNESGAKVTVIERGRVGSECSLGNCGYVCPSHILPLNSPSAFVDGVRSLFNPRAAFRLKPQLRLDLYRWLFQFARRCTHKKMIESGHHLQRLLDSSMREYQQLIENNSLSIDWSGRGLLYVFKSEAGIKRFARTDEILAAEFGVSARRLGGDELEACDPAFKPGLAGAFWYGGDASIQPDRLTEAWQSRLIQSGVTFIEGCAVNSLEKTSDGIHALQTTKGTVESDQYVFATGAWSSEFATMLGCTIPVEPGKGYSLTVDTTDDCPKHSALFPEHHIGITPFDSSFRVGSMMEFVGFDTTVPEWRIQQLQQSMEPYLKSSIADTKGHGKGDRWFGWRPMTWDSLPIIGRVPRLSNTWLATGHNMLGLTLAPVTGRLIAELVGGRQTHLPTQAFSPDRF